MDNQAAPQDQLSELLWLVERLTVLQKELFLKPEQSQEFHACVRRLKEITEEVTKRQMEPPPA